MNVMDVKKNLLRTVISEYEFGRPCYPEGVYEAIRRFSNIDENSRILEVGAGTGQATDLFVSHGHRLDVLEVSDEQADYLRHKYSKYAGVNVFKHYFEDYSSDEEYDLIYSATAFHWIKCENGYPKAWSMLRKGGTMAVFWNVFFDMYFSGGIFDELNKIRLKYMPDETLGLPLERIKEKRIKQITVGDCFGQPEYVEFNSKEQYRTERFLAYLKTSSAVLMLDADTKARYLAEVSDCIERHGGSIEVPAVISLYLVRK